MSTTFDSVFKPIDFLGKGSFGAAFLVEAIDTKKQFVVKKIPVSTDSVERGKIFQEINFMMRLKHPTLAWMEQAMWVDDQKSELAILMRYYANGDLEKMINKLKAEDSVLSPGEIMLYLCQILLGLEFLHSKNVVHRDLKPSNVFLSTTNRVRIGDFGIAIDVDEESIKQSSTFIGTPQYLSPEAYEGKGYSFPADIWATGCILFELATSNKAFNGSSMMELMMNIVQCNLPCMNSIQPDIQRLIKWMLDPNPAKRPTAQKLLDDPYILQHLPFAKMITNFDEAMKLVSNSARSNLSLEQYPTKLIIQKKRDMLRDGEHFTNLMSNNNPNNTLRQNNKDQANPISKLASAFGVPQQPAVTISTTSKATDASVKAGTTAFQTPLATKFIPGTNIRIAEGLVDSDDEDNSFDVAAQIVHRRSPEAEEELKKLQKWDIRDCGADEVEEEGWEYYYSDGSEEDDRDFYEDEEEASEWEESEEETEEEDEEDEEEEDEEEDEDEDDEDEDEDEE